LTGEATNARLYTAAFVSTGRRGTLVDIISAILTGISIYARTAVARLNCWQWLNLCTVTTISAWIDQAFVDIFGAHWSSKSFDTIARKYCNTVVANATILAWWRGTLVDINLALVAIKTNWAIATEIRCCWRRYLNACASMLAGHTSTLVSNRCAAWA
jgi:hypothetical protein